MLQTVETIPHLREFLKFLTRYGDVRYEPLNSIGENKLYRIVAGDIKCTYEAFVADEKLYLVCYQITLPDYNSDKPITLLAVYRGGLFRRLDAWDIPFP